MGDCMKYRKVLIVILLVSISMVYQIHSDNHKIIEKYVVVIDPGHGGMDQGASRDGVYEEDINFQVALYLKQLLEANDITVVMTRTTDVDLANDTSDNRKREDLKQRVSIMDTANVFVSIHMNISDDIRVVGSQVFYGSEQSLVLADMIQDELKKLNQSKFHSKKGDYYILNQTKAIGVIVECGFLSNVNERKRLQDTKYQEQLAYAICKGILAYKNG